MSDEDAQAIKVRLPRREFLGPRMNPLPQPRTKVRQILPENRSVNSGSDY